MDLEQLRQRLAEQVTVIDGWRIGKLNAVDGMAYAKRFAEVPKDAPEEATIEAYAFILSKCIQDESGSRNLDSDEGRALLYQLDMQTMRKLGEAAIAWNHGDAKKN